MIAREEASCISSLAQKRSTSRAFACSSSVKAAQSSHRRGDMISRAANSNATELGELTESSVPKTNVYGTGKLHGTFFNELCDDCFRANR